MHILPPVRPELAIARLTAILEPIAEKVKLIPRKRITWAHKGRQQMYMFVQGELSLLRASDGLLLVTVYEPHLFGIAEMIQPTQGHILRAETESTILRVDADRAATLFTEEGVWEAHEVRALRRLAFALACAATLRWLVHGFDVWDFGYLPYARRAALVHRDDMVI